MAIIYKSEYKRVGTDCEWAKEFFYSYLHSHGLDFKEICEAVGLGDNNQRWNINKGILNPKVLDEIKRRTGDDLSFLFPSNEVVLF